eukprot:508333_1
MEMRNNMKHATQNQFVVAITNYAKYLSENYSNETLVVSLYSTLTSILESYFPTKDASCSYGEQILWWVYFGVFAILLPLTLSTVYIMNDNDEEPVSHDNKSDHNNSIAGGQQSEDLEEKQSEESDNSICGIFWIYCCAISIICVCTCGLISCCIVYDQWMRFAIVILMCLLRTFRPFNCYFNTNNIYIQVGVTIFFTLLLMLIVFIDIVKSNRKKQNYRQPLLSNHGSASNPTNDNIA